MVAEVLRQVDSGILQMQSQSGSLVVKCKKMRGGKDDLEMSGLSK